LPSSDAKRKAKSATGRAAAGFEAMELPEDISAFLDRNSQPVIVYHYNGSSAFFFQRCPDQRRLLVVMTALGYEARWM